MVVVANCRHRENCLLWDAHPIECCHSLSIVISDASPFKMRYCILDIRGPLISWRGSQIKNVASRNWLPNLSCNTVTETWLERWYKKIHDNGYHIVLIDFPCSREETQSCKKMTVCETLLIHKLMHYNQRELMIIARSSLNPSNPLGQLRGVSTLNTNFIRKLL